MFFVLSKTIGYLLLPTNLLIGIGLIGAILMFTRFAALGRKLVIAAVLLLVICGLSPLGKILLYPLEQRFPSCTRRSQSSSEHWAGPSPR